MVFVGIDPGLDGGILALNEAGDILDKWIIPTITMKKGKKNKTEIDLVSLNDIFIKLKSYQKVKVFLEAVHAMPKQGVSSSFNFGKVFGYLEGMLTAYRFPYVLVTPQCWTKEIHAGLSKELDPKSRSLVIFNREYSNLDLRANSRCRNQHEGLLDSLFIAEYGRRKELGLIK